MKNILLVEGSDDKKVIENLCGNIISSLSIDTITGDEDGNNGGIDSLLKTIPVILKARIDTLGIIIDADVSVINRWNQVRNRLIQHGYKVLPKSPLSRGTIISEDLYPKVGIWLMPNNEIVGNLEVFVRYLIRDDDQLVEYVNKSLDDIERNEVNRYKLTSRSKAFIHTWLAWQRKPGIRMSQAITAKVLNERSPIAITFKTWMEELFSNNMD